MRNTVTFEFRSEYSRRGYTFARQAWTKMETSKPLRVLPALIFLFVTVFLSSCAPSGPTPRMKTVIHEVICDPGIATLIATESNEAMIETAAQLNSTELYRTVTGRFFVERVTDREITIELTSRTAAMSLYGSLPDRRLDFDEAFAD